MAGELLLPVKSTKPNHVPPYLNRAGFIPRKVKDFAGGGAFPEIHILQFPTGMDRNKRADNEGSRILPIMVDSSGNIAYDAIVKPNENKNKIVYSRYQDIIPKFLKNQKDGTEEDGDDELEKEIDQVTKETKAAMEKKINSLLPYNVFSSQFPDSKFIKYKLNLSSADFNSGAEERLIKMVEMPVDPLEPPKIKHKKVPRGSGSPPVPVMHSPPRPVTVKDQENWKVPPCISNWKNPKGYAIPLDKRLGADGRGLEDVLRINDNFSKLSEALNAACNKAREAVELRANMQREMMMKATQKREGELLEVAKKARSEAMAFHDNRENKDQITIEEKGRLERDEIRDEHRREKQRKRRLEAKNVVVGKKMKISRDKDREIGEKIALGMASTTTGGGGGEVMYDQKLFNQEKVMASGFATDDQYDIYEKSLFTAQPATLSSLYVPKKDADSDMYGGGADEQLEKIMNGDRFKHDRGFSSTSRRDGGGCRDHNEPVQFEKAAEEADDPFGLDQFLTEIKTGKKAMEKVAASGTMRASGRRLESRRW